MGSNSVSVIIPVWNAESTIRETIESVLLQSYQALEILVCDDGSSDTSEKIVNSFNNPRVKWVKGNRGGRPAIPRNIGIIKCQGEWIAFLDSDDVWLPNKLEIQIDSLVKSNYRACSTNAFRYIPGTGNVGELITFNSDKIIFNNFYYVNNVICSSMIVHKSLIRDITGFPESANLKAIEDYALWLRVSTLTNIAYINKPLLLYRDNPTVSVRKDGPNKFYTQRKLVFNNLLSWLLKKKMIFRFLIVFIQFSLIKLLEGVKLIIKKIIKL